MTDLLLLANDGLLLANEGVDLLEDTGVGGTITTVLRAIGTLIVLFAGVKVVQNILAGRIAPAIKILIGTTVLAALLFNPALFEQMIDVVGNFVGTVVESFGQLLGGAENGG